MIIRIDNLDLYKWLKQRNFSMFSDVNIAKLKRTYHALKLAPDDKDYKLVLLNNRVVCFVFLTGCLRNCLFCAIKNKSYPFKLINLNKLKIELNKIKCAEEIFLVAPEPFIHPQFFDIVKIFSKYFGKIQCFGCAELLADENFVRLVKKAGVTDIQLLFLSNNAETHDFIVGRKGHLDLTLKAIANLKKNKIKTYINEILLKQNIPTIVEDENLIKNKLKLPFIIAPLRQSEMTEGEFKFLLPPFEKIKHIGKMLNSLVGFPLCITKRKEKNQNEQLELSGSMKFNLYFTMKEYIKLNKCKKCKLYNICPGILKEYIKIDKNVKKMLSPVI